MARFVEGMDRGQVTLLPECLEDWVDENNPVRAVDVFVEALDLVELGFDGAQPMATGRPGYKPAVLLTSTAISTACSPAGGLSARLAAILR
jgi:transposase